MRLSAERAQRLTLVVMIAVCFPSAAFAQFTGFVRPVDWGPYDGRIPRSPTCPNGTSTLPYVYYSTTYLGNYCPPDGLGDGAEGTGSHVGVDILFDVNGERLTSSTEVRAIYDGTITRRTEVGDSTGWGNALVIRHTGIPEVDVIYSAYAHLSKFATNNAGIEWNEGDEVKKGEPIGWVGMTEVDSLHLHFQIDREYLDKGPCGDGDLHPFYPNRVDPSKKEENELDADHCVKSHTLHPITFIEEHLIPVVPPPPPLTTSYSYLKHSGEVMREGEFLMGSTCNGCFFSVGMYFRPTLNYPDIRAMRFMISSQGAPTDGVILKVYQAVEDASTGQPTRGPLIATSNVRDSSKINQEPNWYNNCAAFEVTNADITADCFTATFTLPSPISLSSEQKYLVLFERSGAHEPLSYYVLSGRASFGFPTDAQNAQVRCDADGDCEVRNFGAPLYTIWSAGP